MHPDVISQQLHFDGDYFLAEIWPMDLLTEAEQRAHGMREASFLVPLFHSSGFRYFELFIGDNFLWQTTAGLTVEPGLIALLGEVIDRHWI